MSYEAMYAYNYGYVYDYVHPHSLSAGVPVADCISWLHQPVYSVTGSYLWFYKTPLFMNL